jgi:excisionase family DNA binding protein
MQLYVRLPIRPISVSTQLSTAEVAKQAGIHRDTLLRWLREGLLPEPRRDRRGWRVFSTSEASEVAQFARSDSPEETVFSPDLSKLDTIDWDFVDAKTSYLTHGLHPYPAKFIPQIPNALIQALSSVGETVADIFCGSGTTLVEALLLKRNAVGVDANPLACLISEAKTTWLQEGDIDLLRSLHQRTVDLADTLEDSKQSKLFNTEGSLFQARIPTDEPIGFWFEPLVARELAEIRSWCLMLVTATSRTVALTAFSSIIVAVSKQDSDTRYVRREKQIRRGETARRFARALLDAMNATAQFTELAEPRFKVTVHHANLLEEPPMEAVDLVVCSPPYPNAYSYHLYHMTRMLWLGMDSAAFKKIEIGSHRKYSLKGPKRASVETFRRELSTIFDWMGKRLKHHRYACFIIGNSILDGKVINNADLIASVGRATGFVEVKRIHRHLQQTRKAFNPSYGKIKTEHVLILQNQNGARP